MKILDTRFIFLNLLLDIVDYLWLVLLIYGHLTTLVSTVNIVGESVVIHGK